MSDFLAEKWSANEVKIARRDPVGIIDMFAV